MPSAKPPGRNRKPPKLPDLNRKHRRELLCGSRRGFDCEIFAYLEDYPEMVAVSPELVERMEFFCELDGVFGAACEPPELHPSPALSTSRTGWWVAGDIR